MSPDNTARIVVIDDNADAADMFGWLLEAEGYLTRIAYSGRAGLDLVADLSPHIVFCDLGMPCMSGYEFAVMLRARATVPRPLLVAVSGWGDNRTRARTREAGFDLHLVKPTRFPDIRILIADHMTGSGIVGGAPA